MYLTFLDWTHHFLNPGNIGEIENADGYARIGDPACGDFIKVWLRIENEIIVDFKYKVFGCWGAISTTSAASELAIGKSLKEASMLTDDDVIKALNGLPEEKQHCSLLGLQGLHAAIADYLLKDNHRKYLARIEKYRSLGYDIPKTREKMVQLLDHCNGKSQILDIGCGKGHLALALAKSGKSCIAIDISAAEIHFASLNASYHGLDEQLDFQVQDAQQLNFESGKFDAVVSAASVHHLSHPELVLEELLRIVKKGGQIIISDLNTKGQQIVAAVHREDGREHTIDGWSMEQLKNWFEIKGYHPIVIEDDCETILKIEI